MAHRTLYNKVWEKHRVATLESGQDQIFIGLHLIHEVTTPQAFAALRENGAGVAFPNRTYATVDHIIPTKSISRPFEDGQAEIMSAELEKNVNEYGITFFGPQTGKQGIVHVVGPERGLTQPGMTIACGDSHTSTHGAFGSLAFGIGTTEVGLILETQTLPLTPLKVRRITFDGKLKKGLYAKDVILKIINVLGVKGGLGYAYEFGGDVFDNMNMEERMTVCNMSIEGGARIGYVNPDETTFAYLEGREYAPKGEEFERAKAYWRTLASEDNAAYDSTVLFHTDDLEPMVTWGINPAQSVGVSESLPKISDLNENDQKGAQEAYEFTGYKEGQSIKDIDIQVGFIGSCTNSRISDLREAANVLNGKRIKNGMQLLVVPGSQEVKRHAEQEGLDEIFKSAGAQWREPGCSMCLAMNPDRLNDFETCASSSNRNFIGRQGNKTANTLLMSPAMVAAACLEGKVADVREYL